MKLLSLLLLLLLFIIIIIIIAIISIILLSLLFLLLSKFLSFYAHWRKPIRWSQHLPYKPLKSTLSRVDSLGRFRALIEERANENREMTSASKRVHTIQVHYKRKLLYL